MLATLAAVSSEPIPAGAARRSLDGDDDDDLLVLEEPLWIECHGGRLLTMRTPGRDQDLAVGFLVAEGVIRSTDEVAEVRSIPGDTNALQPDIVHVVLRDPQSARIDGRLTRTHEIRPSCGICGLVDADALLDELEPLLPGVPKLSIDAIAELRRTFEREQPLFAATGACHAAMIFGPDGSVWGRGEDVGRHNALDKAIGEAARDHHPLTHGTAMLSGRAGFDLVLKCLRVRIPVILSMSAPSVLSLDLCRSAGATLVGFVREGRAKVYCTGGRL